MAMDKCIECKALYSILCQWCEGEDFCKVATAHHKSREELNEIEKQRTRKLNNLILSLKTLLDSSNVITKKDKLSILKNTHEYVNRLQEALGDAESRYLKLSTGAMGESHGLSTDRGQSKRAPPPGRPAIRYNTAFLNADAPMALLHVNGQFMDCNSSFSMLSGYRREEISAISLFRIASSRDLTQLFNIVAALLSQEHDKTPSGGVHHFPLQLSMKTGEWSCFLCMWLVRGSGDVPPQFQMVVLSGDGEDDARAQDTGTAAVMSNDKEEPMKDVKEERVIISDTRPHNRPRQDSRDWLSAPLVRHDSTEWRQERAQRFDSRDWLSLPYARHDSQDWRQERAQRSDSGWLQAPANIDSARFDQGRFAPAAMGPVTMSREDTNFSLFGGQEFSEDDFQIYSPGRE